MTTSVDLARLPIFPLPGALLFPNAVLPLHVFEPRYRRLLADTLAGSRAFAIASVHRGDASEPEDPFLLPGAGDLAPPRVRRLVGVGTIIAHEPLPDGRSNVLLRGLGRARIDDELAAGDLPYRTVRAIWMPDRPIDDERARSIHQLLVALSEQLADRLPEGGDTLRTLLRSQPAAAGLSDLLAAALVTQRDERLRVFETLDVAARADGVTTAIGAALALLQPGDGRPN